MNIGEQIGHKIKSWDEGLKTLQFNVEFHIHLEDKFESVQNSLLLSPFAGQSKTTCSAKIHSINLRSRLTMTFTPTTHIVTSLEIAGVRRLNFSIQSTTVPPEDFINAHFTNFELFNLLETVDTILAPLTKMSITREVSLSDRPKSKMSITIYSADYNDENTGLIMWRTFTREIDGIIVDHDFFRIPRTTRGKGVYKKVLSAFLQQYVNIGAAKIRVHAALEDGGLAWAKLGFKAVSRAEMDEILRQAHVMLPSTQFALVRLPYDRYYTQHPVGQGFPIVRWAEMSFMEPVLKQSNWHGVVDLTNTQEFSNFVTNAFGQI